MSPSSKGPCKTCNYQHSCNAFDELNRALFTTPRYLRPRTCDPVDVALDALVSSFLEALRDPQSASWIDHSHIGLYLSALFDLAVNGLYIAGLVDGRGAFNQKALGCGPDMALFPFVWMCPVCVSGGVSLESCYLPDARHEDGRDYPRVELLAKPGGRAIGDAGFKVLLSILRATLAVTRPAAVMRVGGGAHGEFDLTISDPSLLVFAEVKAKPLISYPLRLRVETGLAKGSHQWIRLLPLDPEAYLDLFLAASNAALPVSVPRGDPTWPLGDLTQAVADPSTVRLLIDNWTLHLKGYRQWEGESRLTRWHRFGCGNFSVGRGASRIEKRVANTKELPGLDRTDDIKKGAAQLLKFSRFKFDCPAGALRSVLIGNTYAETHSSDYIDPLVRLRITRADEPGSRAEWIFDAVLGLTANLFNASDLAGLFAFDKLLAKY